MATLGSLTFNFFVNDTLTTEYSGTTQLVHNTDLSDNDQDFLIYFGSLTADRKVEAVSNPGIDDITITPTFILPEWVASTAYSLGDSVEPITPNGFRYTVTVAGTSDVSEPTFPTVGIGSTVVDGSVTWALTAAVHDNTEIKLALTSIGLDSAVAGDPLTIGTSINSLVGNKVEVHFRFTNAVTTVSNNTSNRELALTINEITETNQ